MVSCSGGTCTVTLGGSGSMAGVLGTTISIRDIDAGRATLRVGDQDVVCVPGQTTAAGRLTLRCTAVTEDTVQFTASA